MEKAEKMLKRQRNRLSHASIPLLIMATMLLPLLGAIPLPAQAASQPQITLSPNAGYYDTSVQIHGVNFTPNSEVTVSWSTLNLWEQTLPTDTTGAFILIASVPTGLKAGTYVITATDAKGKTASANFALNAVFCDPGSLGVKTAKQYVKWTYTSNSFFCDSWKIYHISQNGWYNIMVQSRGIYVVRLTYNGTTYVYDLAGGAFNQWPKALRERVTGFGVVAPDHIQGTITLSDPTDAVVLASILVDIYSPKSTEDYYGMVFTLTPQVQLNDLAFYVAYNLDVNQPPNSALYDAAVDGVYQYYGPSNYGNGIPAQYLCTAGFGSVLPASTHHDVDIESAKVLQIASKLGGYDFNYRDQGEVHGDAFGDCAIGMQWCIGTGRAKTSIVVPVAFAASDENLANFDTNLVGAKMLTYQTQPSTPFIALTPSEAPGSALGSCAGWGFMPYSIVNLRFGGVSVGTFTADSTGSFNNQYIVPTSVTGNYSVTATDEYGLKATSTFKVVELTWQWLSNKIDQYNAQITALVTNGDGTLSALIRSDSGSVLATLTDINATLAGLIGNSKDVTMAKIDTTLGAITAKVNEINARIVEIIGNAKGDILARIDSNVGQALVKVDAINATLTGIIGNAKGDILARIDTTVGQINATVQQINAKLVEIVGDAKGDILARIDSEVGQTLVKADQINATLVGIIGSAKGDVLARIDSKVGETLVKVSQINATLVEIIGNSKGDILARIDSKVGETLVKVDAINATLTGIIGGAKGDILARIDTNVGTALVKLDTINGVLGSVSGNMATIQTSLGKVQVSLDDIKAEVIKIDNTTATIQTSLGTLTGKVTAIQGDLVTIQTDIGTLKTDTKLVRSDFSLQPIVIAAVIEIAAISGIIYTIYAYRKREFAKKELIIAETSR
jgi:hypothetical protein